jgi:glycine/D-amino acid oxidase-like deaminating enzyme
MSAKHTCDVAVIGAGPAGIAAAATVAAKNTRVTLIDCASRLGGSVTAAMHRTLCGLYAAAPRDALDVLNEGLQHSMVARMLRQEPALIFPRQLGRAWVLEFPTSAWEAALADICSEAKVEIQLGSRVTAVRRDGTRLTAIQLDGATQDWIDAKVVIDCTGDGGVLQLAGEDVLLPLEPAAGRMLGGFALRLAGLSGDLEFLRLQIPYVLAHAVERGVLPASARFTLFYPGPGDGEGVCKLAIPPDDFTSGRAERFAERVLEFLIKEVSEFAAACVIEKSPRAMPRDGRRLRGKFVISETDVRTARRHGPDAVHAWWPLEHWDVAKGPTYAYPPPGEHYDIPDEALRCNSVENLLAAGACLSATAAAATSIRAAGICLATGAAAGRLAALLLA